MDDHASTSRRQFFRNAGRAAAGLGAVAVAGRTLHAGAGPAGPDSVGTAATAAETAERARLTGPIAFPFADFEPGDLVCLNNFGTCRRNHQGVDIGEARLLPVPATLVACADGVVTQRNDVVRGRPGRFVEFRGDDERWYRYHHIDEIDGAVQEGDRVSVGQRLGTMGTTGNTIWPHLHFEVWVGDGAFSAAGTALDPVPLLVIPGAVELDARLCD